MLQMGHRCPSALSCLRFMVFVVKIHRPYLNIDVMLRVGDGSFWRFVLFWVEQSI